MRAYNNMEGARTNHQLQRPLLFNPVQSRKHKHKQTMIVSPPHNLYTAPFHISQSAHTNTPSSISVESHSLATTHFINPKPTKTNNVFERERRPVKDEMNSANKYE